MSDFHDSLEKVPVGEPMRVSDRNLNPKLIDLPLTDQPVYQVVPVDPETRMPIVMNAGLTAGSISGQFIGRVPGRDPNNPDGPRLIGLMAVGLDGSLFVMAIAKADLCFIDIVLN